MPKPVVLIVDDDKAILRAYARRLSNVIVITAGSVAEAIAVLPLCPDIVLTDYSMPGGNGLKLLVEVQRRLPNARRFLMTGSLDLVPDRAGEVAENVFEKASPRLGALLDSVSEGGFG